MLRKNSDADQLIRASNAGSVHTLRKDQQFQAIAEESLEASRVLNSGDLENNQQLQRSSNDGARSGGGLADVFAQTDHQQQQQPPASGNLAGLFEATAEDQDRKKRRF